jgi:hypothetical protein
MEKGTAKAVPPDDEPIDKMHPDTLTLQTDEWVEAPDYNPPGTPSNKKIHRREEFARKFMHDDTNTPTQWHFYVVYGFYHWDDPAKFKQVWETYKIKTKPVAISKAKHIWKVYQFHRINDLEIHPHLHSKAENWATPYL